jgi:hypothetical protein
MEPPDRLDQHPWQYGGKGGENQGAWFKRRGLSGEKLKLLTWDFKILTRDFKLLTWDFKILTRDFQLLTQDFKILT